MDTPAVPTLTLPLTTLDTAAVQRLHLQRLERLLRLRREHEPDLNKQGLRLLDRAVFAAYCDCRDNGVDEKARRLIEQARFQLARSTGRQLRLAALPQPSAPSARPEA